MYWRREKKIKNIVIDLITLIYLQIYLSDLKVIV